MVNSDSDIEEIKKYLSYSPETGLVHWRDSLSNRVAKDAQAGCLTKAGYRQVKVFGKFYGEHRLAWAVVHGSWPKHQIDHINGVKSDNRIENLRDVEPHVNAQNKKRAQSNSISGVLGVKEVRGKWRARITTKGVVKSLGTFLDIESASNVYLSAKRSLHAGCTI